VTKRSDALAGPGIGIYPLELAVLLVTAPRWLYHAGMVAPDARRHPLADLLVLRYALRRRHEYPAY
jgi:hypothetical protein